MNITIDTREQVGFWTFGSFNDISTQIKKVDYGDYTLTDYPMGISIDRKKTLSELANNVKEKRFRRELENLKKYEEAYIVCEFPFSCYSTFPIGSGIPKEKWKYLRKGGNSILREVQNLESYYGIPFLYCNGKFEAEKLAVKLFTEYQIRKELNAN
jgi:hypothetical protein